MKSRFLVNTGALAVSLLVPAAALAQGVAIDHKEIGCIVAGKYPRMNACFAPASLVKKARVYFRPETLSTWYYVEMTSDAPCHAGVLLKPSTALIDKKIFYYVDVQGEGTGRTPEYGPIVVASEEECRSRLPIAPLSATGPAAVYPSFPAGFVGGAGVSSGVVAGGVAAAAAVAGGAILLTDDDSTAATTPATVPATNPPATTPPVTVPPTVPERPPALVMTCTATPRSGDAPLRVDFATFPSGGTGTYEFLWSFGDGATDTNPNPAHTFLSPGVFNSTVRVLSGDLTATCSRPITVTTPPPPPPGPSPSPSPVTKKLHVTLAGSGTGVVIGPGINCPGDCDEAFPPSTVVTLNATPAAAPPTVFKQWSGDCTGTGPCVLTMDSDKNVVAHFELIRTLTVTGGANNSDVAGSVTSNPAGITCSWIPSVPCTDNGPFINGSTVTLTAVLGPGGTRVQWGGACLGTVGLVCNVLMNADKSVAVDTFRFFQPDTKASAAPLVWSTELVVPDAEGQVVMNGRIASAVRPGPAAMAAEGRTGVNRVEAVLVRGAGRPGTWRFELAGMKPGSLRVVAGTVAVITGNAVVFRLQGKRGERIVFTFDVED